MRRYCPVLVLALLCGSCTSPSGSEGMTAKMFKEAMDPVHSAWLILLSGFSAAILFFIWKNLTTYPYTGFKSLPGIVFKKVGDEEHDLGILGLALAIACWFCSGICSFCPEEFVKLLGTSVFSSLNSCFLLLFLRHLDKEDLPPWVKDLFLPRGNIWFGTGIVIFVTLLIPVFSSDKSVLILVPDLGWSVITLCFISLSFYHLLNVRTRSNRIALLAQVPIAVTLLAELSQMFAFQNKDNPGWELVLVNQTLLFAYKPLLIISYFVLIYSWQLKRLQQMAKSRPALPSEPEAAAATLSGADILENRAKYKALQPKDWIIVDSLARGMQVPEILKTYPSEFINGRKGVENRIRAIASAFGLEETQKQTLILLKALQLKVLRLEDLRIS